MARGAWRMKPKYRVTCRARDMMLQVDRRADTRDEARAEVESMLPGLSAQYGAPLAIESIEVVW